MDELTKQKIGDLQEQKAALMEIKKDMENKYSSYHSFEFYETFMFYINFELQEIDILIEECKHENGKHTDLLSKWNPTDKYIN